MANMSYVRFQNTLRDLLDCEDHIHDDLSDSMDEENARLDLVAACKRIVEATADWDNDEE